jgi:hypothetical protein
MWLMLSFAKPSLIAIMLGRLRMATDEAMDWFQEITTLVFSRKKFWGDGAFKATNLEQVIGRMAAKHAGSVNARLIDRSLTDGGCKT